MNNRLPKFTMALAAMLVVGTTHAQELSEDQQDKLMTIEVEYAQKGVQLEGQLAGKLTDLAVELQREGRLDSEKSAVDASKRTNAILKEISKLYGEFIKIKVEFLIASKNTLTPDQRILLLSELKTQATLPYDTMEYLQPEVFDLPINLTVEQRMKLVKLEAKLLVKEVELERDVELTLLKLEAALISGQCNPDAVDPLVMNLAKLAGQEIDNRVNFFIHAKDVLSLDQKRMLSQLMGLN